MGVGMWDPGTRCSGEGVNVDGFVVPPQSPGFSATVLCGILARGPASTVFDREASSWSVAGGRP